MSVYSGDKSLDAEILIDFERNTFVNDYSLNLISNPYNSNFSVKSSDLDNKPFIVRFYENMVSFCYSVFAVFYMITTATLTYLIEKKLISNKNYQIEHQKILRDCIIRTKGVWKQAFNAPFTDTTLTCHLYNNLWLKYELTEECEIEIQSISLKRHFDTVKRYGKYDSILQDGWDLTFTFKKIPTSGQCIIEHV